MHVADVFEKVHEFLHKLDGANHGAELDALKADIDALRGHVKEAVDEVKAEVEEKLGEGDEHDCGEDCPDK